MNKDIWQLNYKMPASECMHTTLVFNTCEMMFVSYDWILADIFFSVKINQIPQFIFEKQARRSKNESKIVDTLCWIQICGSLHQNKYKYLHQTDVEWICKQRIYLQVTYLEFTKKLRFEKCWTKKMDIFDSCMRNLVLVDKSLAMHNFFS